VLASVLLVAACGSSEPEPAAFESPERAVVAWFDAVDAGDATAAARAVDDDSLAVILSIENDLDEGTTAAYLDNGVPIGVQQAYWQSFGVGFTEFASKPISSLTVGESATFEAEGVTFAAVPVSGGPSSESLVFTRLRDDGTWEVDMVATLGDGFSSLLADAYDDLGSGEAATTIRSAYVETVAPALWAAVADGSYGEDFNRVALTLLGEIQP
jgi:hypothetical protein